MDYFRFFAYATFLFALFSILGAGLYYLDLILDPEADDTPKGRHRAETPAGVRS